MYDLLTIRPLRRFAVGVSLVVGLTLATAQASAQSASPNGSLIRKITGSDDKLEITTNTSRILTLGKKIPRVQVNNPELLSVTPLSATQVQISARKPGVTQVNLWDEDGKIHTVDVYIYGDVRELEHALKTQFPNSSVKVYRYSQSLVLTGFIDRPDYVDPIRQLAEDYAPKVINNISVGGVQQVLLKVKIYEVSRTKLRQLGVDIATLGSGGYFGTSVSGLLNNIGTEGNPAGIVSSKTAVTNGIQALTDNGGQTVEFAVTNGNDAFFGFIDALQQNNIAKILAEPNIVAVSGRPATFNVGGEIPILIPQGLGNIAIEYKPYGTQIDFLPIVLGNGKIRLEVRPRISELDDSRAVLVNDLNIPALTVRQVDTAVEMNAGQTFAIAGLIQQRTVTLNRGIPFLADIPIIGVPFRRVEDSVNETELLVLVTPELVDAMDPHEVPQCGPGMGTVSPRDSELYLGGKIEVSDYCSACQNKTCECGPGCVSGGFPSAPESFMNGTSGGGPVTRGPVYNNQFVPAAMPLQQGAAGPQQQGPAVYESPMPTPAPMPAGPSLGGAPSNEHFQASRQQEFVRATEADWKGGAALIGPVGYDDD